MYGSSAGLGNSPRHAITVLTAGLKCAPLTGPKTSIRMYRPPTVANGLASKAIAALRLARSCVTRAACEKGICRRATHTPAQ